MGGSNPILQHHTPIVHLKHFVGDRPRGHVWTYSKLDGKVRSSIPDETAKERHFYTIELADGAKSYALENHFGEYESKADAPYQEMLRGGLPRGQARDDFAHFLALMVVRTISARRQAAELDGQMMQVVLHIYATNPRAFNGLIRRMEMSEGRSILTAEREAMLEAIRHPSRYEFDIPKNRLFDVIGAADPIREILLGMRWHLVRPRHGYLITSDNPVYVWNPPGRPPAGAGRFMHPAAEVTFPLSPKCLLLIARSTHLDEQLECDQASVESMNNKRARGAERCLFAHLRDERVIRLAKRFKDVRPQARVHYGGVEFGPVKVMRK